MSKIESLILRPFLLVLIILVAWGSPLSFAEEASTPAQSESAVVEDSEKTETNSSALKGFSKNPVSSVTSSPGVNSGDWINAILGLIAVVSLIFLVAWFVKRFTGLAVSNQQQMRIVSAITVGTRERIALVEVADKQLLVGITQHNINLLHSFEEPVVNKNDKTGPDFASRLQSILSKGTADTKST